MAEAIADHIVTSKNQLRTLLAKCTTTDADLEKARGALGGMIADAVKEKHLDKWAFGNIRRLNKMPSTQRQERLFHFWAYIEHMNWDKDKDLFRASLAERAAQAGPLPAPRRTRTRPRLVEAPSPEQSAG